MCRLVWRSRPGVLDPSEFTIISGGQTGADRAALDFAIEYGIPHGGWCPRWRLAEDGAISSRYALCETPSRRYAQRTEWNIRDSDATVAFTLAAELKGGTLLTIELAKRLKKPVLHLTRETLAIQFSEEDLISSAAELLQAFIAEHRVDILNVAGPRASQEPQVAGFVHAVLQRTLSLPLSG